MEDYLLEEEKILTRSESDEIILTTHRIRQQYGNHSVVMSIMLDQISCIKSKSDSYPVLLVLGIICVLMTPLLLSDGLTNAGISASVIGIALVIMYFLTRRSIISICSGIHTMQFQTKGMEKAKVLMFINLVEDARKNMMRL